jgi:hypothetical protein
MHQKNKVGIKTFYMCLLTSETSKPPNKNGYYVHKQNELYRDWWVTSFQLSILSFNSIDHSHKVYIPANKVKTLKSASFSKDASCYTIFNYLLQLYCITTCYLTFKTMLLLDQGKHKLI